MKLMDDMKVEVEETTLSGSIERFAFRNASVPKNMFLKARSPQEYTTTDWLTEDIPKTGNEGSGDFCFA